MLYERIPSRHAHQFAGDVCPYLQDLAARRSVWFVLMPSHAHGALQMLGAPSQQALLRQAVSESAHIERDTEY